MQFFDDVADVPADFGPSAVTVGKFDGVHLGHRAVLDALRAAGEANGLVVDGRHLRSQPAVPLRSREVPGRRS